MRSNVISTCYVIEDLDLGAEPVIYLDRPVVGSEFAVKLHMYPNVFEAKAFIQKSIGTGVYISVERLPADRIHLEAM
jgi:hypothetical protein